MSTYLIVDVGAVATKVGLVEQAGGEYRIAGATRTVTTDAPPYADVTLGVRQGILQLQALTGRRLLDERNELIRPAQPDGDGVDAVAAATSAALPLETVVIGLSRDYSVASAHRAVTGTYAVVEHTIAVDEESGRWGTTAADGRAGGPSAAVEKLAALEPDLVVMVGGTDGGASVPLAEMANIVAAAAAATDESKRPLVVFAGNAEARTLVIDRLGGLVDVRVVDNVLPELERPNPAPLQAEIESIYRSRQMARVGGLDKLGGMAESGLVTSADAYTRVAEYLAVKYQLRVLAVDLGAATTALVYASDSDVRRALVEEVNVGYGLAGLVRRAGLENLMRWVPASFEGEMISRAAPGKLLEDDCVTAAAHAALLNQSIRPWTTPAGAVELAALNAAGRYALSFSAQMWRAGNAPPLSEVDLLLLGGAPPARGGKPGATILMALDALGLSGIFSIAADTVGLAPALGALARINPQAAAQALESDCLSTLGTAFVPNIPARMTQGPAMKIQVEPARGGQLQAQVDVGSLELIPLGQGEKAQVEIRPQFGVNFGPAFRGGVFRREVQGGTVGLIVDARGRPLPLPESIERHRELVQEWLWEMGG
jgi:hypothetical protein